MAAQEAYDAVLRGWEGESHAADGRDTQTDATEGKCLRTGVCLLRVVDRTSSTLFIMHHYNFFLVILFLNISGECAQFTTRP